MSEYKILKSALKRKRKDDPAALKDYLYSAFNADERAAITAAQTKRGIGRILRGKGLYDGPMVTGSGGYSLGKLWRKSGLGKTVAGVGRDLISAAGDAARGYIGSGDYVDNQLIAGGRMAPSGSFANDETDSIVLTDCEYVRDIYAPTIASGTSGFNTQSISINPGLADFAPHLSQIACNYSEYKILQCVIELRPQISESTVNNGMTGMCMVATQYALRDNSTSYFSSKEMIMQYHGSVSGRITDHIRHGVECDPTKIRENDYIVRTTDIAKDESLSDFDHGLITIATNNIPSEFSNKAIYEMWVYYTIELRQRKSGALSCVNQQVDQFVCNGNLALSTTTGVCMTDSQYVNGSGGIMKMSRNSVGGSLGVATTPTSSSPGNNLANFFKYVWPAHKNGRYEIKLALEGTALSATTVGATISKTGQVRYIGDLYGGSGYAVQLSSGVQSLVASTSGDPPLAVIVAGTTTSLLVIMHVDVTSAVAGTDNSIQIDVTGLANGGTITSWFLKVEEVNNVFSLTYSNPLPEWQNLSDGVVYVP